jgi:hypothetical protein
LTAKKKETERGNDSLSLRPFPTPPADVQALLEVSERSRTQMFQRVLIAVDCLRGSVEAEGDAWFMEYVEEELFPFLESECERAAAEEGLTPILRWEESILAGARKKRGD